VFVPGAYNNAYFTNVEMQLTVTNHFPGTTNLSEKHVIKLFNSQI
jgi:hypothetical protein